MNGFVLALLALAVLVVVGSRADVSSAQSTRLVALQEVLGPHKLRAGGERIMVGVGRRIVVFDSRGDRVGEFVLPGPRSGRVLFDVARSGVIVAAESGGDAVHVLTRDGQLLETWTGAPSRPLSQIDDLALDPRGSVLVIDRATYDTPPHAARGPMRYGFDGRFLGRATGSLGPTVVASNGSRWTADASGRVSLTRPSGDLVDWIGEGCTIGGGDEPCPGGPGAFGDVSPDLALSPDGTLATLEPSLRRLQFFSRSGWHLFTCSGGFDGETALAVGFESATTLLAATERSIWRISVPSKSSASCRPAPRRPVLTLSRSGKRRVASFTLRRGERATLDARRLEPRSCGTEPRDAFDPATRCRRETSSWSGKVAPKAGRRRVVLPSCPRNCPDSREWRLRLVVFDAAGRVRRSAARGL